MSDYVKTYSIKIETDIKNAEKSIIELEKKFNDFADKNQSSKALQGTVNRISSEFSELAENVKKQIAEINTSISDIANPDKIKNKKKPQIDSKFITDYTKQVEDAVGKITQQAELLTSFISDSDAGKFENFILKIIEPLTELTNVIKEATNSIKGFDINKLVNTNTNQISNNVKKQASDVNKALKDLKDTLENTGIQIGDALSIKELKKDDIDSILELEQSLSILLETAKNVSDLDFNNLIKKNGLNLTAKELRKTLSFLERINAEGTTINRPVEYNKDSKEVTINVKYTLKNSDTQKDIDTIASEIEKNVIEKVNEKLANQGGIKLPVEINRTGIVTKIKNTLQGIGSDPEIPPIELSFKTNLTSGEIETIAKSIQDQLDEKNINVNNTANLTVEKVDSLAQEKTLLSIRDILTNGINVDLSGNGAGKVTIGNGSAGGNAGSSSSGSDDTDIPKNYIHFKKFFDVNRKASEIAEQKSRDEFRKSSSEIVRKELESIVRLFNKKDYEGAKQKLIESQFYNASRTVNDKEYSIYSEKAGRTIAQHQQDLMSEFERMVTEAQKGSADLTTKFDEIRNGSDKLVRISDKIVDNIETAEKELEKLRNIPDIETVLPGNKLSYQKQSYVYDPTFTIPISERVGKYSVPQVVSEKEWKGIIIDLIDREVESWFNKDGSVTSNKKGKTINDSRTGRSKFVESKEYTALKNEAIKIRNADFKSLNDEINSLNSQYEEIQQKIQNNKKEINTLIQNNQDVIQHTIEVNKDTTNELQTQLDAVEKELSKDKELVSEERRKELLSQASKLRNEIKRNSDPEYIAKLAGIVPNSLYEEGQNLSNSLKQIESQIQSKTQEMPSVDSIIHRILQSQANVKKAEVESATAISEEYAKMLKSEMERQDAEISKEAVSFFTNLAKQFEKRGNAAFANRDTKGVGKTLEEEFGRNPTKFISKLRSADVTSKEMLKEYGIRSIFDINVKNLSEIIKGVIAQQPGYDYKLTPGDANFKIPNVNNLNDVKDTLYKIVELIEYAAQEEIKVLDPEVLAARKDELTKQLNPLREEKDILEQINQLREKEKAGKNTKTDDSLLNSLQEELTTVQNIKTELESVEELANKTPEELERIKYSIGGRASRYINDLLSGSLEGLKSDNSYEIAKSNYLENLSKYNKLYSRSFIPKTGERDFSVYTPEEVEYMKQLSASISKDYATIIEYELQHEELTDKILNNVRQIEEIEAKEGEVVYRDVNGLYSNEQFKMRATQVTDWTARGSNFANLSTEDAKAQLEFWSKLQIISNEALENAESVKKLQEELSQEQSKGDKADATKIAQLEESISSKITTTVDDYVNAQINSIVQMYTDELEAAKKHGETLTSKSGIAKNNKKIQNLENLISYYTTGQSATQTENQINLERLKKEQEEIVSRQKEIADTDEFKNKKNNIQVLKQQYSELGTELQVIKETLGKIEQYRTINAKKFLMNATSSEEVEKEIAKTFGSDLSFLKLNKEDLEADYSRKKRERNSIQRKIDAYMPDNKLDEEYQALENKKLSLQRSIEYYESQELKSTEVINVLKQKYQHEYEDRLNYARQENKLAQDNIEALTRIIMMDEGLTDQDKANYYNSLKSKSDVKNEVIQSLISQGTLRQTKNGAHKTDLKKNADLITSMTEDLFSSYKLSNLPSGLRARAERFGELLTLSSNTINQTATVISKVSDDDIKSVEKIENSQEKIKAYDKLITTLLKDLDGGKFTEESIQNETSPAAQKIREFITKRNSLIADEIKKAEYETWKNATVIETPRQAALKEQYKENNQQRAKENAYKYAGLGDEAVKDVQIYNRLNARMREKGELTEQELKLYNDLTAKIAQYNDVLIDEETKFAKSKITKEEFDKNPGQYATSSYLQNLFGIKTTTFTNGLATEQTSRDILAAIGGKPSSSSNTSSNGGKDNNDRDDYYTVYKSIAKELGLTNLNGRVKKENRSKVRDEMRERELIDEKNKLTQKGIELANQLSQKKSENVKTTKEQVLETTKELSIKEQIVKLKNKTNVSKAFNDNLDLTQLSDKSLLNLYNNVDKILHLFNSDQLSSEQLTNSREDIQKGFALLASMNDELEKRNYILDEQTDKWKKATQEEVKSAEVSEKSENKKQKSKKETQKVTEESIKNEKDEAKASEESAKKVVKSEEEKQRAKEKRNETYDVYRWAAKELNLDINNRKKVENDDNKRMAMSVAQKITGFVANSKVTEEDYKSAESTMKNLGITIDDLTKKYNDNRDSILADAQAQREINKQNYESEKAEREKVEAKKQESQIEQSSAEVMQQAETKKQKAQKETIKYTKEQIEYMKELQELSDKGGITWKKDGTPYAKDVDKFNQLWTNKNGLLSGDTIPSPSESDIKNWKEYDDLIAVGYDRQKKMEIISQSGTSGNNSVYDLLRLNHPIWDEVKANNFFNTIPEDGLKRYNAILEVVERIVKEMVEASGLTEEQIVSQLKNIKSAQGGYFKANGNDSGWSHFATYSDSQNKDVMNKPNGITYKVYAAFDDIKDLNENIISSLMEELSKAGFKGRLKTTTGSTSFGDKLNGLAITDQLVVHGSSKKDQEIAYNTIKNFLGNKLSYLGGGIDTPDGSFSETLRNGTLGKYLSQIQQESQAAQQAAKSEHELAEARKEASQAAQEQPNKSDISLDSELTQSKEGWINLDKEKSKVEELISEYERLKSIKEDASGKYYESTQILAEDSMQEVMLELNKRNSYLTNKGWIDFSYLKDYSKEYAEAFLNGVKASTPEMEKAFEEFAKVPETIVRKVLQIQSPSKVMEDLGYWTVDGFAKGVSENQDEIKNALIEAFKNAKITNEEVTNWLNADDITSLQLSNVKKQGNNKVNLALKSIISERSLQDQYAVPLNDFLSQSESVNDVLKKAKSLGIDIKDTVVDVTREIKKTGDVVYKITGQSGPVQFALKDLVEIDEATAKSGYKNIQKISTAYSDYAKVVNGIGGTLKKYNFVNTFEPSIFGNSASDVQRAKDILAELTNIKNGTTSSTIDDINKKTAELITLTSNLKNREGKDVIGGVVGNLDQRKQQLDDLVKSFNEGDILQTKYSKGNTKLTYSVRTANDALKTYEVLVERSGVVTRQLISEEKYVSAFGKAWQGLKAKFSELAKYFTASFSFMRVINTVKSGINIVKELDSAMTEMRKVSNDTTEALEKFAKESHNIAQEVGSTAVVIQNSAADWMRLGYSIDEAAELSKNTAVLMNVSEFTSIDEATQSMVAMVQAFSDANEDVGDLSLEIIDKLNNIGNNFSISTSELAESLKRSSGTLIEAGNNLDEAIALTTAGNAIIQDAESVGSAMKVISMRIRGTSAKELEDIGEDAEGLIETTSKLEDKVKSLTAINGKKGISLLDDNGNYRTTYQILQDIADIWEEIGEADKRDSQNRQAALLEALAGKTRAQALASLLQNGEMLRDVYEKVQKSEGSAQKENEEYMSSIEAHLQIIQEKWQQFWDSAINREQVNWILDRIGELLDLLNNIGTGGALASVGTFFLGKKVLKSENFGKPKCRAFFKCAESY